MSLNQCHFISHVFERFGFIPEFKTPSVVEFSVLRVVAGCVWSNAIKASLVQIYIFPFLTVPHVLASAAEDTTFRIVLQSVCMRTFLPGSGFIGLGEGQSFR